MVRSVRWVLPLLAVVIVLGTAQGASPALSSFQGQAALCASVKFNPKTGAPRQLMDCGTIDPNRAPEIIAREVLAGQAAKFGLAAATNDLRLLAVQPTSVTTHVRFQQIYRGVPVYLGQALVQYSVKGEVQLIVNNTLPNLKLDVTPFITADDALTLAQAAVSPGQWRAAPRRELVIYGESGAPTLAWHIRLYTQSPAHDWHIMVSATDRKVMAHWDQLSNDSGTGLTFDPNPVQTSGDAALRDGNDAATTALDTARVSVTLNHLVTDTFKLKGAYVDVTSTAVTGCDLPYMPGLADEPSRVYSYNRADDRFEEVLVYAAIDGVQSWFQSLGITNANNRPIPVNVHCIAADNSYYSDDDRALHFGDGGVDDAEDADIVIHEYGHAVHDNQVPGWGPSRNTEQRAMGEGWGDFLAGMYNVFKGDATFLADYKYCIGEWDATSYNPVEASNPGGGCLRWINGRSEGDGEDIGVYAGTPTEEHDDGRFWSAALTCVYEGMGANLTARDNVTKIVLQSHFSQAPTTSNNAFEDAVDALLLADRNLLGGQHQRLITDCMVARGIIELPKVQTPTLTYPVGGEVLPPLTTVNITWTTNDAPAETTYVAEYTAQCRPTGDFFDDIEGGQGGWMVSHASGSQDWRIVTNEGHSPTHSWFGPNADAVTDLRLVSSPIAVSAGSILSFWHRYSLEGGESTGYDGGVVEISSDGTTWTDLGPQMTQNGYNRTISTSFDSPIGGQRAFSSTSVGWLETRATLTEYVGQTVRLRFRLATDRSVAQQGWWVDDVLVGTPVTTTWEPIGRSTAGAVGLAWTTPALQGFNYCVRVRGEAEGYQPSTWSQSQPFTISDGTLPTLTPTRTVVVPPTATSTPTATPPADRSSLYLPHIVRAGPARTPRPGQ